MNVHGSPSELTLEITLKQLQGLEKGVVLVNFINFNRIDCSKVVYLRKEEGNEMPLSLDFVPQDAYSFEDIRAYDIKISDEGLEKLHERNYTGVRAQLRMDILIK